MVAFLYQYVAQYYFSDKGVPLFLFKDNVSRCWTRLFERRSNNGGVVCAECDNFCAVCSRGVAGGDGKSIAKCIAQMKERKRKEKKRKRTEK
jgi:hypothetical protein